MICPHVKDDIVAPFWSKTTLLSRISLSLTLLPLLLLLLLLLPRGRLASSSSSSRITP